MLCKIRIASIATIPYSLLGKLQIRARQKMCHTNGKIKVLSQLFKYSIGTK